MMDFLSTYGTMLLALAAAGLFAGLVAGLFGIGGGVVIVPTLFFLLSNMGYEETAMHVAVSTSLATIILTSLRSVAAHNKRGAVDWDIIRSWSPWIVLGAVIGMLLAGYFSKQVMLGIFGTILILFAAQFYFGRPNWKLAPEMPKGIVRAVIGSVNGALSSIMGIGGGTLGVTLMTLCAMPMHRAVATAAGWGVAIGLPGAMAAIIVGWGRDGLPPFSAGFVNLPAFALISVFTVLMAPVGAALAHKLNADRLRRLFGILLAVVSARMLWQAAGL
ncbi:sulfite exporter TauE/SafE family protein [Hyphomonas sp.]|uniref:sulfite exporter TauE/SafE family protein n=1 Tax=Hyphomonas sp. TaxID=87 RepID=UPI0025BA2583|nr:sulfite exporter TauE/SafE family protein [Hyphomonas sp.]